LFGHEKSGFHRRRSFKVGLLNWQGGTLFLDEIGELKPELQVKL